MASDARVKSEYLPQKNIVKLKTQKILASIIWTNASMVDKSRICRQTAALVKNADNILVQPVALSKRAW